MQRSYKLKKKSNKTMTVPNKRTDINGLTRKEYDKILNNSITYKKASNNLKKKTNAAGKRVLRNKNVLKRMQTNG